MIDLGIVKPGSTIRIPFSTFDSNDPQASTTITGFAVADIRIYKDGGTTERASTAGFTATTDFDTLTGIHLVVIDLSDNTTAGFYAAGSEYIIAVADVTLDAATVRKAVARFEIGYPDAVLNTTIATLSTQTSFTLTDGPAEDDALNGWTVIIHDVASDIQLGHAVVSDYVGSTKTVTLTAGTSFTAAATDNISLFPPANVNWIQATAQTAGDVYSDTTVISSDTTAIHSQTTVIESDSIVIESSIQVVETDTGNIYSDTTIITSDTAAIESELIVVHSETTAIQANTVTIVSDTAVIEGWGLSSVASDTTAIESELIIVHSETTVIQSDTTVIESDTTAIHSQTTVIESDSIIIESSVQAIETDTTNIYSDTTVITSDTAAIESELIVVHSETTAIQVDTGNIYSDTTIIASDVVLVYSDTTAIHSDTTIVVSDTTAIHSQTTVIESDSIVIESNTIVIESDTTFIEASAPADRVAVAVTFTGGTTTTAVLGNVDGSTASSVDDYYNGRILVFNSGTLANQATDITDYVGSTKTATITAVTTAVTGSHTAVME